MVTISDKDLKGYITKYTPELRFHAEEQYFPLDVQTYFNNVSLCAADGTVIASPPLTEAQLAAASSTDYLLIANQSIINGSKDSFPLYVNVGRPNVAPAPQVYDLQYWIFAPFRGSSVGRFGNGAYQAPIFSLSPCGEHQGDWKVVTVRIDENGNLLAVFYSAHTGGTWYPASMMNQPNGFSCNANGAPIVYIAKFSHSCYTVPNQVIVEATKPVIKVIPTVVLQFSIVEETGDEQPGYVPSTCIMDGFDSESPAKWLQYKGIWGPKETQQISEANLQKAIGDFFLAEPEIAGLLLIPTFGWVITLLAGAVFEIAGPYLETRSEAGASTPINQAQWMEDQTMAIAGNYTIFSGLQPESSKTPMVLGVHTNADGTKNLALVPYDPTGQDRTQLWQINFAVDIVSFAGMYLTNAELQLSPRFASLNEPIALQSYVPDRAFIWYPDFFDNFTCALNQDFEGHVMWVKDKSSASGTPIITTSWHNYTSQWWTFKPASTATVELSHSPSHSVLDDLDGGRRSR